jgi:hypothetical protein
MAQPSPPNVETPRGASPGEAWKIRLRDLGSKTRHPAERRSGMARSSPPRRRPTGRLYIGGRRRCHGPLPRQGGDLPFRNGGEEMCRMTLALMPGRGFRIVSCRRWNSSFHPAEASNRGSSTSVPIQNPVDSGSEAFISKMESTGFRSRSHSFQIRIHWIQTGIHWIRSEIQWIQELNPVDPGQNSVDSRSESTGSKVKSTGFGS